MFKVVDLNYLRDDKLDAYLTASDFGVLFEYHLMEMSKGSPLRNLRKSLRKVAAAPDRFVLCKAVVDLISITGSGRDTSPRDLIDSTASANLSGFCRRINEPEGSILQDPMFTNLVASSQQYFAQREVDAAQVVDYIVRTLRNGLKKEQVKSLRLTQTVEPPLTAWIFKEASSLAKVQLQLKGYVIINLTQCMGFRYMLAGYLLCLHWMISGGIDSLPIRKMVNDITDMMYIALGTYFDGILTNEIRMNWIYKELVKTIAVH